MYQKWLQAFHTVAVAGGFTAAAKALNVGQPTISTHVKTLEDYFGVELFFRRGRSVELTPVGRTLLTITRGLYGHEEEAVALLQAARTLRAGQLNVGAIGPYDVMELLEAFRDRHPKLALSVNLGSSEYVLDRLDRFENDVVVLPRAPVDKRFYSLFYNRHSILVTVHVNHRLAKRKRIRIEDLEGEEMVLRTLDSTTRQAFDAALVRAGVTVRPVMEINHREAVREAVSRGLGTGVVSEPEFAPHPRLKPLVVENADMHTEAYVVCLAERRERPLIDAFFKVASQLIEARDKSR